MSYSQFIPKELSWLSFNGRLLQEASNSDVPLYERIKFLGIYSNNLDEFFRVRVANIKRFAVMNKKSAKKIFGENPKTLLDKVSRVIAEQSELFDATFDMVIRELEQKGIIFEKARGIRTEHSQFVKSYFDEQIRPHIAPIILDKKRPLPQMKDGEFYLAIRMSGKKGKKFALIEVPCAKTGRFHVLPEIDGKKYVIMVEEVIKSQLADVLGVLGYDNIESGSVKVTKDAEFDIYDDLSDSYMVKINQSIKQRETNAPVRFLYDEHLPADLLSFMIDKLGLSDDDSVLPSGRIRNSKDFIAFPKFADIDESYASLPKLPPRNGKPLDYFARLTKEEMLLFFPYHSFANFVDFLRQAAIDPDVKEVMVTQYRVASDSNVINALINAAQNGKRVLCVVELKARFDEKRNLECSKRMADAGIKIVYGVQGLKVHAKVCHIARQEEQGRLKNYACVGTGNFNEDTAGVFSDFMLMTTDVKITNDVRKVFEFLEYPYKRPNFNHLLVSPYNSRRTLLRLIRNEAKNAQKGKKAWIHFKLNNLSDVQVQDALYAASTAGVKVKLNVRGFFSLVTGQKGQSENIEAIGIIDRYLEHARVYAFCNDDKPVVYIASADLMVRNLDRRVEVVCPIYSRRLRDQILRILNIQWKDNQSARILDAGLKNKFKKAGKKKVRAQLDIHRYLSEL